MYTAGRDKYILYKAGDYDFRTFGWKHQGNKEIQRIRIVFFALFHRFSETIFIHIQSYPNTKSHAQIIVPERTMILGTF